MWYAIAVLAIVALIALERLTRQRKEVEPTPVMKANPKGAGATSSEAISTPPPQRPLTPKKRLKDLQRTFDDAAKMHLKMSCSTKQATKAMQKLADSFKYIPVDPSLGPPNIVEVAFSRYPEIGDAAELAEKISMMRQERNNLK